MMFNYPTINEFSTVITFYCMPFDSYGRLIEESYPDDLVINNSYDTYGYLTSIRGNGKTLFTTQAYNKHGTLSKYTLGTNMTVDKGFDDKGRLTSILARNGIGTVYHNMEYGYHGDCNIAYKVDKYYGSSYNTKEWYKYDVMNRLTDIGLTSITAGVCTNYSSRITYDCNRIISKTGIGNYQYGGTPVNAVKQLLNGNNQLLNANDCSLDYTSFHKVSSISEGDNSLFYTYGVDDNRVKSEYSDGVVLTTKYYAGSGTYEEIIQGSVKTQRYYIMGEDGCVAMYVKSSNSSTTKLYYVMKDHQGSVIALVEDNNNSYTVRDRYSYDAWGLRRNDKQWGSYTFTKPDFKLDIAINGTDFDINKVMLIRTVNGNVFGHGGGGWEIIYKGPLNFNPKAIKITILP